MKIVKLLRHDILIVAAYIKADTMTYSKQGNFITCTDPDKETVNTIHLPLGLWEPVCFWINCTEEQAKKLVDYEGNYFKHYERNNVVHPVGTGIHIFTTALESLLSILTANNLDLLCNYAFLIDRESVDNPTLGHLVSYKMDKYLLKTIPGISEQTLHEIKYDQIYPNCIPVVTFRNMIRLLNINIETAEKSMYRTYDKLDAEKQNIRLHQRRYDFRKDLFENKESMAKYITRLKELLNE